MLSFSKEKLMHHHRPIHQGDSFSLRHPKMPPEKRAKLFLAFDALRGFDAALDIAREFRADDADLIERCDEYTDLVERCDEYTDLVERCENDANSMEDLS